MHPITQARWPRCLAGIVLAAGLAGAAANGQPMGQPAPKDTKDLSIGEVKVDAKTGALVVPLGGLVRFDPKLKKGEIPSDILVRNENVVQVRLDPNNPSVLLMTGRAPGLSRLSLVFKDRPRLDFDVIVQPDYDLLRSLIRRTVPTANVEVTPGVGRVIILSGYVTSPQDADIITRLAISQAGGGTQGGNVINAMQVGGVQQVQIDVVIASVNRNEVRSRGFDFGINTRPTQFNSILSGLLTPAPLGTGGVGFPTISPNANLQLGLVPAAFFGALRALRTEGLAKFLAEPRVVTQTGRPAQFRSGGQQAILSPSSGITGPGVTLVPFGTELEVLPIVYGNGQIWMEINPRVTAVNQGLGITTVFGATPGFSEQSARCAVMLSSGQTFAIGGLIQNSVQATSSRVPVLGDLPFVGTLFSRVDYNESETELVILVTPRLVGPLDCNQVPRRLPGRETRSPDDYELFLEGILEAPRGQRKVWNGRCYNAAYKCDPTNATMPCVGQVCNGPSVFGSSCGAAGCATGTPGRAAGYPVPAALPPVPTVAAPGVNAAPVANAGPGVNAAPVVNVPLQETVQTPSSLPPLENTSVPSARPLPPAPPGPPAPLAPITPVPTSDDSPDAPPK